MQNFKDTFETRKRSFISVFSVYMTTLKRSNKNDLLKAKCYHEISITTIFFS